MKKVLIISILLFTHTYINAQVADTAAYLQQVVANKNSYIGKSFSTFEQNLKTQIKQFNPFAGVTYDVSKETSTFFGFIHPGSMNDYSIPGLQIIWQPYLDHKKAMTLFRNTDGGNWTPEVDSFYSSGIIKDIMILP